jgi:hypothetical protein
MSFAFSSFTGGAPKLNAAPVTVLPYTVSPALLCAFGCETTKRAVQGRADLHLELAANAGRSMEAVRPGIRFVLYCKINTM